MTKTNNIPQGYKNSALGIIPEEWEVKKMKKAGNVQTGNTPPTNNEENYGNEYLFVSPFDLKGQKYIKDTEKKLSNKGFLISRQFPEGSILFTCIGSTIGKIGIASRQLTSNQQINAVIVNTNNNNEFLYYHLEFNVPKIRLIAGEQAVPIINKSQFENIKLLLPPLPEQQKISEILSVWDAAIEKQNGIIEKLELRKRGLMQQLLTGKKRLRTASGEKFSGEWKKVKLMDFCNRLIRKNSDNCENVVTISAQRGFVRQTDFFNKTIASEITDNYFLVKRNEFCYNKSYSNGYPMGAIKRLKDFDEAVVTTLYICFSVKSSVNIDFIEQVFSAGMLDKGLMKVANEGGRAHGLLNVTPSDFFNIHITIPSLSEQTAIAEILITANNQIELEKQKLTQLKAQKKGLMQVLLTGKKRVKIVD